MVKSQGGRMTLGHYYTHFTNIIRLESGLSTGGGKIKESRESYPH